METAPNWEIVIGLEAHVQLDTRSKIFSGAATRYGAAPNSQACGVDIALPGVLPVLNRKAVECAIRFGLAVDARIAPVSVFARKNYFYPDLPKGYQISQYEAPVVVGGTVAIVVAEAEKSIRLVRAHLEEDAGKSVHEDLDALLPDRGSHALSGIDLNRAGTPLLEIVSEPDLASAAEAVAYAKALHSLVRWIGICDGNMQEGSFRVDANVSVRRAGTTTLGTRCEIKNLNSFRFLERAIRCEAARQIAIIEEGGHIVQETRLFDPGQDETRAMRSKEDAHDYRYFPDPDLLPLTIADDWIAAVVRALPELPHAMQGRFQSDYGLSAYDAKVLTSSPDIARYFESTVAACGEPAASFAKPCANWIMGELSARLNRADSEAGEGFEVFPIRPAQLSRLVQRIQDGTLSSKLAKMVFDALWSGEADDVDLLIEQRGLRQVQGSDALAPLVDQVIAVNAKSVAEYRAGKDKALNALVGQVMKATQGKADPQQVGALLRQRLEGD